VRAELTVPMGNIATEEWAGTPASVPAGRFGRLRLPQPSLSAGTAG
jgi:hypothetical protein